MDQKFEFFSDDYVFDEENPSGSSEEARELIVRLDKWLWAARFFKTRAVARAAVEKGRVFYNGERAKPSREIEMGATIYIQQGRFEKTVIVRGLSTRRRSTDEALQLFEETEESRLNREEPTESQPSYNQSQGHPVQYQPQYLPPYKPQQPPQYISQPFYPVTERDDQPIERRAVRFLRRVFNRDEPRAPQNTCGNNNPKRDPQIFD